MKNILVVFGLLFFSANVSAQDKKPYQIYTNSGQEASYKEILKDAEKADVVLFGEYHNNPIIHWLQLELTKDLYKEFNGKRTLILGAEMLEADNQIQLNKYIKGEINQKQLDSSARLWKNYRTDYKPLVDFAKINKLEFIATNIPRKFASMVYKDGFEVLNSLSVEEKSWIAPLPIKYVATLSGYANMLKEMEGHGGENLPKAQAIKDATMAHFILKNKKPNATFLHYNGTYHSNHFQGIMWYLQQQNPKVKVITIATAEQADIIRLDKEHINSANYIIVVDADMTKTH